jgi:hypothetical protein
VRAALALVLLLALSACRRGEPTSPTTAVRKRQQTWLTGFDAAATRARLQGEWKSKDCTFVFSGDSLTRDCEGDEPVRDTFSVPLPGRLRLTKGSLSVDYGIGFVGNDQLHFGLGVSGEVLSSGIVIPTWETRGLVLASTSGCEWHRLFDDETLTANDVMTKVPCTFSQEEGTQVLRYEEPTQPAPTPRVVMIVGPAVMSYEVATTMFKRQR